MLTSKKAIPLALLSNLLSVLLLTAMKAVNSNIPRELIILLRTAIIILLQAPFFFSKTTISISFHQMCTYFIRSLLVYGAMYTTYYAYSHLPLSLAGSIGYTEPMMQMVLSTLIASVSITRSRWCCIAVSYLGVLLSLYSKNHRDNTTITLTAIGSALLANFLAALVKLMTKQMTRHQPVQQIVWYNNLSLLLIAICLAAPSLTHTACTSKDVQLISMISILALTSQLLYTYAVQWVDLHILSPLAYCKLPFFLLLDHYLFHTSPTYLGLLGSSLILTSNYLLYRQEMRDAYTKSPTGKKHKA